MFASVVGRFAQGVRVETRACPEFVRLAEAGETASARAREAARRCLAPLLEAGIDQLVLGCTHFPFLREAIQAEAGPGVTVVDPSPAVARQTGRVLREHDALNPAAAPGSVTCYTTGEPGAFRAVLGALLGAEFAALAGVRPAAWDGDRLRALP
ncbi:MAG: aspartate/glutamate racemase family protein [Anaerolineae bacterium]|nr:aspartate/glutamate racemase family protein [Anaerolineae bacterium]